MEHLLSSVIGSLVHSIFEWSASVVAIHLRLSWHIFFHVLTWKNETLSQVVNFDPCEWGCQPADKQKKYHSASLFLCEGQVLLNNKQHSAWSKCKSTWLQNTMDWQMFCLRGVQSTSPWVLSVEFPPPSLHGLPVKADWNSPSRVHCSLPDTHKNSSILKSNYCELERHCTPKKIKVEIFKLPLIQNN